MVMDKITYSFKDDVKIYPSEKGSGWYYVLLPKKDYGEIREIASQFRRGFGSVKVQATLGDSSWKTSIFPDTERKQFILFLKKQVRLQNEISLGNVVSGEIYLILLA